MTHDEVLAIKQDFLKAQYKPLSLECWAYQYAIPLCDALLETFHENTEEHWQEVRTRTSDRSWINFGTFSLLWKERDKVLSIFSQESHLISKPKAAVLWPILKRYAETGNARHRDDQALSRGRTDHPECRQSVVESHVAAGPDCDGQCVCDVQEDSFGEGVF